MTIREKDFAGYLFAQSPGIPGFVLKSADKLQASIEVFYLFIANGF